MYIKTHLCFGTVSTGVDSLWSIFCLTQNFEIMSFYCVLSLMGYLKGGCSRSGEMESHVCNMLMTGLKEEAGKKVGQRVEDGEKKSSKGASGSHAPASKAQPLPDPAEFVHTSYWPFVIPQQ